ncbi:MAG: hypothetical protein ACRDWD_15860 [Acidimicrobiia bacterium]
MRRNGAFAVAIIAVVAVAAPAVLDRDGFPLSNYPMFAEDRGRESDVATAVGVTRDGERRRLSPELIGGSDEPILASAAAERATASSSGASALCTTIAQRAVGDDDLRAIEVVTERYDTVEYFAGDHAPKSVTVHARCGIGSQ